MTGTQPRIVCFSCRFSWGYLTEQSALPTRIPGWVPLICGGKIEAEQILSAFRNGADGVLLAVCPIGECHFQEGNLQLAKRVALLHQVLAAHGIAPERLRFVARRDADGTELLRIIEEFSVDLQRKGKEVS